MNPKEIIEYIDARLKANVVPLDVERDAIQLIEEYAEQEVKKNQQAVGSGSLRFSEREVDFAYLCGVFNTSGIDGLHNEIQRLKELGKEPHDIIESFRKH